MTLQVAEMLTPVGQLAIAVDSEVVAAGFCNAEDLLARWSTRAGSDPTAVGVAAADLPATIVDAVEAYFDGELAALAHVPVRQSGTPLQESVWQALRFIKPGETWSYGQLAAAVGRPAAVRAVGQACGANLVAPFVPCHRAVRSDGALGGYAFGLGVKEWLLRHEGVAPPGN